MIVKDEKKVLCGNPELSASAFEQKRICAICGKIEYQNYKSFSNILLVLL